MAKTGVDGFPMVWEAGGSTWRHYGIGINSETWLLDKNGKRIKKMFALDEKATILKAIG